MSIWKKQNEQTLPDEFFDFELSQPLVKQNQTSLVLQDKSSFDLKAVAKKTLANLLIFAGVFLTFESSLVIFQSFIAHLAHISRPSVFVFAFVAGLLLTVLGSGGLGKKKDWMLYGSIPLMSFIFAFLFTLAPADWHGRLFGGFSVLFYPAVLLCFYYFKEYLDSKDTELK